MAYYQQGELLKTGRVFLPTELPAAEHPALVPFGYFVENGRAIPQYTPGFPLLLAAASFVGLTFFVTPVVGLVSCILMFLLLRDLTDRWNCSGPDAHVGFFSHGGFWQHVAHERPRGRHRRDRRLLCLSPRPVAGLGVGAGL